MKRYIKLLVLILALATMLSFAACKDQPVNTGDGEKPADSTPETPDNGATEGATDGETPPATDPNEGEEIVPGEPLPEGMMVYYQDFNSLDNGATYAEIMEALGWKVLFKNQSGIPAELEKVSISGFDDNEDLCGANTNNSTLVSVKDGRLYFENNHGKAYAAGKVTQPLNGNSATDSYFRVLSSEYMEACGWGDYTVQYEVEYDDWSEVSRYATMLLNYSYKEGGAPSYCSSHLRVTSILNHEVRFEGSFVNVSSGSIISGADKTDKSIAVRIFGMDKFDDKAAVAGKQKITITIKAVRRGSDWTYTDAETGAELGFGYHIFINGKLASTFNPYQANGSLWDIEELLPGDLLAFKVGGKIDVYLDNVAVWTGCGDMPTDTSTDAYKKIVEAN